MTFPGRAPSSVALRTWWREGPDPLSPSRSLARPDTRSTRPPHAQAIDPIASGVGGARRSSADRHGSAERGGAIATTLAALHRKDAATLRHCVATATLAMALAAALGRSERDQLHAYDAGLVHDLGKLFVPRQLLRFTGRLEPWQLTAFRQHAVLGAELARRTPGLTPFVAAIAYHHERWDGEGYPERLEGDAIPWDARVIAVADVAAVMRAGRPYRAPSSVTEVATELARCAGRQFCPLTVAAALGAPRFAATLTAAVHS